VLGAALVFVVVVVMVLQEARRRADERWDRVVTHWESEWRAVPASQLVEWFTDDAGVVLPAPTSLGESRGGGVFQGWRQDAWPFPGGALVLRQETTLFGSTIEARVFWRGGRVNPPGHIDAIRAIFVAVDVELVFEP